MPRYVAILIWCNKVDIKIHHVASTLEKLNEKLQKTFGDLSEFVIEKETLWWPGYTTGTLEIVSRYGVHLKQSHNEKSIAYTNKWNEEHGDVRLACDCCYRRILVAKVSSDIPMTDILKQIHNH